MDDEDNDEQEIFEVTTHLNNSLVEAPQNDDFARTISDFSKTDGLSTGFKKRLTRAIKKEAIEAKAAGGQAQSKQIITPLTGYDLFKVVTPPYNLDYLAQLYELSAPHKGAVDAKIANIVGLGYDFIETRFANIKIASKKDNDLKNAQNKIEKLKNLMNDMVDSWNNQDEFAETLSKVWKDYETTGNGFIEIGRADPNPSDQRIIKYVGHIPSTTMRVRRDKDGYVQVVSNKAVFFRNFGDDTTVDDIGRDPYPNEIIHLKKYSPTNTYYGISDVVSATMALTGNEFAGRFNIDFFENSAVPRMIIVSKGKILSKTAEAKLLKFFETNYKGQYHRSLYIPLPPDEGGVKNDFEIKPVEAMMQEGSFDTYRKSNRDEILMAHRTPLSKLGASGNSTVATANDADKTFKETVAQPEQFILEKKLNKIIKEFTPIVELKLNELALTDAATQATIDQQYSTIGAVVPNEIRSKLGMPARDGGDEPYVPENKQLAADQKATAGKTRTRDTKRIQNTSDKTGGTRNAKGENRKTA